MDYKYIEQLLERYWECQTTLQEESILRSFFSQENVPVHLLPYRELFLAESKETETERLGEDFDKRILAIIENEKPVKAVTITMSQRLRPFFRAAAIVAIIVSLGTAAQKAMEPSDAPYPTAGFTTPATKRGMSVAQNDTVRTDSVTLGHTTNTVIVK